MQILDTESIKSGEIAREEKTCTQCSKRPAEIFQINGDFCLECWQTITHTNI